MSDTVISIENLSKSYQLGAISTGTFYGDVKRWWAKLRGLPDPYEKIGEQDHRNRDGETVWALRDINFSVQRGEAIGIIGRNGAGKSTLLKILSRVTAPTSGVIKAKGRVASLLEVGTGFHSELTGRENIFLNGAIMGMSRAEVHRKFDEIVDFSGVDRYIDTPVKRYSSGMYVRLAFAVAAHLEPEILVVDEVLAVGDAEFQKKCLGKMSEVASGGRTVLFVSHNMTAVSALCDRALLLDRGQSVAQGSVESILSKYFQMALQIQPEVRWAEDKAPSNGVVRFTGIRAHDTQSETKSAFDIRHPIGIELEYEVLQPDVWFTPSVILKDMNNVVIFNSPADAHPNWDDAKRERGTYRSTCWIPGNLLVEGTYSIRVVFWGFSRLAQKGIAMDDAISLNVFDSLEGDSVRGRITGTFSGVVRPKLDWATERIKAD
jgi:lipopolysaccharide transport system ATP-binding protein